MHSQLLGYILASYTLVEKNLIPTASTRCNGSVAISHTIFKIAAT